MSIVFIKKLNAHELGHRHGLSNEAGHFLYIFKDTTAFFPPLSTQIPNDTTSININGIESPYIFHNSKFSSSDPDETRNEHRLYFNSCLRTPATPFDPDDIIILEQVSFGSYNLHYIKSSDLIYHSVLNILNTPSNKTQKLVPVAILKTILPGLSGDYNTSTNTELLHPISNPSILVKPVRKEIGTRSAAPSSEELEDAFKQSIIETTVSRSMSETERIFRDTNFRKVILHLYENKCPINDSSISYGSLCNVEAAHIIPKEHGGGDHPSNGITLSRDLHWAFDRGFFTIDESYTIVVNQTFLDHSSSLDEINGLSICLPSDTNAYPNLDALRWHEENIFDKFPKDQDLLIFTKNNNDEKLIVDLDN